MQLPSIVSRSIGWLAYEFSVLQPLIPMYLHLIASATFPIYAGAHSSLSRPSSAAERDKSKKKKKDEDGESEDEHEESPQHMEGLSPTDALMFPIVAGIFLTGLYFLIEWLQDPALLNKILNWYFATFSVFAVSRLVSDGLDVVHSVLFPHNYIDQGVLFRVTPRSKVAVPSTPGVNMRSSPLPSVFSRLPLPQMLKDFLWMLHILPSRKLHLKAYIRRILDLRIGIGIHGLTGLLVGLATVIWFNFVSKPWFLTNLMGFGFSYGTLQLLSPTTFWTGSLVLSALFVYDIYFVFFTPMMITVAKHLDAPVKLLFPRPPHPEADPTIPSLSMLGLGDIVLPGIMIGLALRFDLYMFYLRKQTQTAESKSSSSPSPRKSTSSSPSSPTKYKIATVKKAPYIPVSGSWGDRLWTSSLLTGRSASTPGPPAYIPRNAFPKPYFNAGLAGYVVGMMTTLGAMQVSDHGQPALLYLVPGVLTALWGTAWARGEVELMWGFSDATEEDEAGSEETGKKRKEEETEAKVAGDGENGDEADVTNPKPASRPWKSLFFSTEKNHALVKRIEDSISKGRKAGGEEDDSKSNDGKWFSFSVVLPSLSPTEPGTKRTSAKGKDGVIAQDGDDSPRYSLRSTGKSDEQAEKRQRVR